MKSIYIRRLNMKKKILLMISLIAIMTFVFAVSISAAYYCDKDGNLVEAGSENIAYEFDAGGDRTIDGNKCFRISAIYLHDTTLTKIVFPVASQVKSGYAGIAPQGSWAKSLLVYSVDENGARNEETSYATQIQEVEFLSGVDFDGANGLGAFSGFTSLSKMVFNGNVSMGNDATNKGGMFKDAPITSIVIKGSGTVNLVITRHISKSNNLTVTFDKDCTSHVYVLRGSRYFLPDSSIANWTFIFNPNLTFGVYSSDVAVTPICEKGTPTTKIIMAVDNVNTQADKATGHGLLYSLANQEEIVAEVKGWCDLGYASHENATRVEYVDGFASKGAKIDGCVKCNKGTTEELPALFVNQGLSKTEYEAGNILISYVVNHEAIDEYEQTTHTTLTYGIFAVSQKRAQNENEVDKDIINADGKAIEGVANIEFSKHDYDIFAIRITGFATDEHKNAQLALGAYVIENGKVTYLQATKPLEGSLYTYVSYNSLMA